MSLAVIDILIDMTKIKTAADLITLFLNIYLLHDEMVYPHFSGHF